MKKSSLKSGLSFIHIIDKPTTAVRKAGAWGSQGVNCGQPASRLIMYNHSIQAPLAIVDRWDPGDDKAAVNHVR